MKLSTNTNTSECEAATLLTTLKTLITSNPYSQQNFHSEHQTITPLESLIIDDHLFVLSKIHISVFKLNPTLDTFALKLQIKMPTECSWSQSMIFKPDVNINKLYIEARIKRHLSDYGEEIGYIVLYCLDVDSIISLDVDMDHVEFKLVKINEYSKQDLNIPQLNLLKQSCQYFRNTSLNLFMSNDQKIYT